MSPDDLRPGMIVISVNGQRVPPFTIDRVARARTLRMLDLSPMWNVYRHGGRIELTLYASDHVTTSVGR